MTLEWWHGTEDDAAAAVGDVTFRFGLQPSTSESELAVAKAGSRNGVDSGHTLKLTHTSLMHTHLYVHIYV